MEAFDAAELVRDFSVGPLTLTRTEVGEVNDHGEREAGAPVEITLDPVAVHPISGSDLDQVPEADRTVETVRIYATVALSKHTDRLTYRGARYRIINVEDLEEQGGVYLAIGQREEGPSS